MERGPEVREPSPRAFGLALACGLAVVALWPLVRGGGWRPWALVLCGAALATTAAAPRALRPASTVAGRIARGMGRVVDFALLGLLFYAVFTPVAVAMRIARRDPLGLSFDRDRKSYWEDVPPEFAAGSMRRRF